MKIVVAVCVYNRFQNIKRWVHCWQQCNTENAELVIIHNYYGDQNELNKYKKYCEENNITYVPRNGKGFDIGAMQDVCRNRLPGFPDYDYLLWCCDDTWPMSKDFISPFIDKLKPGVGITCMQIASSIKGEIHVRTTGFCIRKEIAENIQFPVDPVTTKQDCYLFEHRAGMNTLTNQIRAIGLSCEQVAPNETSPLWDTGYWKRLDRQAEHYKTFPSTDKVTFICTITKGGYPQIVSSLLTQINPNWELLLIHNGASNGLKKELPDDKRITFIEVEDTGFWGHPNRAKYLQEVKTEYVCITNNDNYVVPVFVDKMIKGFKNNAVATYCSGMIHSYKDWQLIPCKLERGYIDCSGVMLRTKEAQAVGWNNITDHSADWLFFEDLIKRYGKESFAKVEGVLLVHN